VHCRDLSDRRFDFLLVFQIGFLIEHFDERLAEHVMVLAALLALMAHKTFVRALVHFGNVLFVRVIFQVFGFVHLVKLQYGAGRARRTQHEHRREQD
jgi:hypothetical protein